MIMTTMWVISLALAWGVMRDNVGERAMVAMTIALGISLLQHYPQMLMPTHQPLLSVKMSFS